MKPFWKGVLIGLIPALIIWGIIIWAILAALHILT